MQNLRLAPGHIGLVDGKVEVISADPVDGAVDLAAEQAQLQ